MQKKSFAERKIEVAEYYVQNDSTVRDTAEKFGISKSAVHSYLKKLEKIDCVDKELRDSVILHLLKNKQERHMRGGLATRKKFLNLKK